MIHCGTLAGLPPTGVGAEAVGDLAGATERGVLSLPRKDPGIGSEVLTGVGQIAQDNADAISELAPPKVRDTFSPESIAFNAAQSIPQMAATLGATVVGGAVGGPVGAFAGAFSMSMAAESASIVDDAYRKLKQVHPDMSDDEAYETALLPVIAAAAPAALLDAGTGGEAAAAKAVVEHEAKSVAKSLAWRVLWGGRTLVEAMAEEGLTEPIQGVIENVRPFAQRDDRAVQRRQADKGADDQEQTDD